VKAPGRIDPIAPLQGIARQQAFPAKSHQARMTKMAQTEMMQQVTW
jgi:hypothetical protein